MSTNTLGPGSAGVRPVTQVQDFTYAGVATRVMTNSPPTDADWGASPPPDGTIVVGQDQLMWVRVSGAWYYVELRALTR